MTTTPISAGSPTPIHNIQDKINVEKKGNQILISVNNGRTVYVITAKNKENNINLDNVCKIFQKHITDTSSELFQKIEDAAKKTSLFSENRFVCRINRDGTILQFDEKKGVTQYTIFGEANKTDKTATNILKQLQPINIEKTTESATRSSARTQTPTPSPPPFSAPQFRLPEGPQVKLRPTTQPESPLSLTKAQKELLTNINSMNLSEQDKSKLSIIINTKSNDPKKSLEERLETLNSVSKLTTSVEISDKLRRHESTADTNQQTDTEKKLIELLIKFYTDNPTESLPPNVTQLLTATNSTRTPGIGPKPPPRPAAPPPTIERPLPRATAYSFTLPENFTDNALEPLNDTLEQRKVNPEDITKKSQTRRSDLLAQKTKEKRKIFFKQKITVTDDEMIKSCLSEITFHKATISQQGPNYLNLHGNYLSVKSAMGRGEKEQPGWSPNIRSLSTTYNQLTDCLIETEKAIQELEKYQTTDEYLLNEIQELKSWHKDLLVKIKSKENNDFMEFCLDTREKMKSLNDVQGAIVSSYTEDWSERNIFREHTELKKVKIAHENLKKWDPKNSEQYSKMIKLFEELNKSSNELAEVLKEYETNKTNSEMIEKMQKACDKFNLILEDIKENNEKIIFAQNDKNCIKTKESNLSIGDLSKKTFTTTLEKITKEVEAYKTGKPISDSKKPDS